MGLSISQWNTATTASGITGTTVPTDFCAMEFTDLPVNTLVDVIHGLRTLRGRFRLLAR